MSKTKSSLVPESVRMMKAWQKIAVAFFLMIAAIGPAWTGMINSFDTNGVDSAHAKAVKADAKADLAFELLAQKVDLEAKVTNDKLNRVEIRVDKLDDKLDAVLMRLNVSIGRGNHTMMGNSRRPKVSSAAKKPAEPTKPKNEGKPAVFPDNLELAYQQHQKKK
jgi:hypothetical protein